MDLGMKAWWDRVRSGLSPRKAGSSPAPVPYKLEKMENWEVGPLPADFYADPEWRESLQEWLTRGSIEERPPRETCEASEDSPGLAPPATRNGASHSIIESLALRRERARKIALHASRYGMSMEEFRAAIERDVQERGPSIE